MSNITLSPNVSGTGTFTVSAPNSNTNRSIALPDASGTVQLQGSSLTQGTQVASTSGTAIDFTGIPSWAKRVTVLFNNMSTSGTSIPIVQLGSGSVQTTGYAASATANSTSGAVSTFTTGMGLSGVSAAGYSYAGAMILHNISGNNWIASGYASIGGGQTAGFGGTVTLSGALDRVRVTTVAGTDTFDAGSINIMYEG